MEGEAAEGIRGGGVAGDAEGAVVAGGAGPGAPPGEAFIEVGGGFGGVPGCGRLLGDRLCGGEESER